jgi:hypothetical protein
LVAFERVYDNKDRTLFKQAPVKQEDVEEINLMKKIAPKKVYIGKKISPKVRNMLISLFKKYKHVFFLSYEDLKAYREDLFQHEMPLKLGEKPFRQK